MRRSFLRLVATSVLVCWAVAFVVLFTYSGMQSWTRDRAQGSAVFLAYELLDAAEDRPARLEALRPHYSMPLSLVSVEHVRQVTGQTVAAGDHVPYRASRREEWYFLVFADGRGALAAGPVHPAYVDGFVPIGVFIAIFGLPVVAAVVAVRLQRQLTKVERASEALAVGELSARVENADGPSAELAASFNAMAERVERLVRSRDELVQAVSHELGSPLSRLRFQLELHAQDNDATRLDAMRRELDALDELVAELLSFVQADDVELETVRFDPTSTVRDLAELASTEIDVDVDVQPTTLAADRRLFQRAVENVLRNAVRHADTRVRVAIEAEGDEVVVVVQDDGPGIPEALRAKVTTPFFRIEPDRDRKRGGTGLGLAIVSRIVQRHGGALHIGASPWGGAQVETRWPKA
ncbi:MAG: ATP-binding protein [Deltaproteobacteria bacterium]